VPELKGTMPPGCAAYGMVIDGNRILTFGGMVEGGDYSNELFELNLDNWEWKKLSPKSKMPGNLLPSPRPGHSFSILDHKVFLFGGLENVSKVHRAKSPTKIYPSKFILNKTILTSKKIGIKVLKITRYFSLSKMSLNVFSRLTLF
jgi:hypothetical protein